MYACKKITYFRGHYPLSWNWISKVVECIKVLRRFREINFLSFTTEKSNKKLCMSSVILIYQQFKSFHNIFYRFPHLPFWDMGIHVVTKLLSKPGFCAVSSLWPFQIPCSLKVIKVSCDTHSLAVQEFLQCKIVWHFSLCDTQIWDFPM